VKGNVTDLSGTNLIISSFLPTRISNATKMLTTLESCLCMFVHIQIFEPVDRFSRNHVKFYVSGGHLNAIRI